MNELICEFSLEFELEMISYAKTIHVELINTHKLNFIAFYILFWLWI